MQVHILHGTYLQSDSEEYNKTKMKKKGTINPRLIIILIIIGIVYFGFYYTGSLVEIRETGQVTYKSYTYNEKIITYSVVYDLSDTNFKYHVYKPDGFNNEYTDLSSKLSSLNINDYECSVSGMVDLLCRNTDIRYDSRCAVYNKEIEIKGTINKMYYGDQNNYIWGCVIDPNEALSLLPKTFVRPSDGSTRNVGGFGFKGQVKFTKKQSTTPESSEDSPISSETLKSSQTDSQVSELSFIQKINLWIDGLVNKVSSWIDQLF